MAEASKKEEAADACAPDRGDFDDILKLIMELSRNPATAPMAESVASTLLAVVGSGPSFAAMQSLVAANQASGAMYFNAVANQQATNILGMVATMNCVQALMDKPSVIPWPDVAPRHEEPFE
ncbi:RebB family R body protein [Brevundimonas sp.]|uniref:RebB family R body protein n=1 Tax=Brevundimonas sp. TaxID=1871086 RepID=UPI0037C1716E